MARAFAAASLVLSLVLLHLVNGAHQSSIDDYAPAQSPLAPAPSPLAPAKIDCPAECSRRCKESKRPNLCARACGSCCNECNCVPPGTYGNYEACPCYFNIKTHNQTRKCP